MQPKSFRQPGRRASARGRRIRLYGRIINRLDRVFPALAVYLLDRLWYAAPKTPASPREQQLLQQAVSHRLDFSGRPLRYYHWGQQGPLVGLLHGWSGHSGQMAALASALVAAGYQVLALDAPAHGASPGRRTNLFQMTAAWEALLQNFPPVEALVSHSFGGIVATYGLGHGLLRCRRLALIASPPSLDYLVSGFEHSLKLRPGLARRFRTLLQRRHGDGFWPLVSPMDNARHISIPTLVCHGEKDHVLPYTLAAPLAQRFPHGELHISPGQGHRHILSDPATLARVVEFIKES